MQTLKNELNSSNLKVVMKQAGIEPGDTIYVTGNMGKLGIPNTREGTKIREKEKILEFYASTILDYLGDKGTIVFPTHSWELAKNNEPFIPETTQCDYLFSEYLRKKLQPLRQKHPFASISAYGAEAKKIINESITRHPYGPNTPFEVLRNTKSYHLSIGIEISMSFTAAHYCEFVCGVPYRYTKSFIKRIVEQKNQESEKEFFVYVCYLDPKITRDRNKAAFLKGNIIPFKQELGKGFVEIIRLDETINKYISVLLEDPYIWTREIEGQHDEWPWFQ